MATIDIVKSSMLDAIMETFVDNKVIHICQNVLELIFTHIRGNSCIVWCVYQDYLLVLEIRELLGVCTT